MNLKEKIMRPTFIASLLLSSVLATGMAAVSQPKADTPTTAQDSGFAAPQLLNSSNLHISNAGLELGYPNNSKVVLSLNIDAQGNVQHVHVVNSTYPELNANVLDAASKFHFRPATLNGKAVFARIELNVAVTR